MAEITRGQERFGGGFGQWVFVGGRAKSRYVVALAAFAAALLFRYVFSDSLGLKVPYLQFYPAIILAAWYGGLGPGVLNTALSTVVAMYFLLPPLALRLTIQPISCRSVSLSPPAW
jgi:hypothetical protein